MRSASRMLLGISPVENIVQNPLSMEITSTSSIPHLEDARLDLFFFFFKF
jgi:hypothetical protein